MTLTSLAVRASLVLAVAVGTPLAIGSLSDAVPSLVPAAVAQEDHDHQWYDVTGTDEEPKWARGSDLVLKCSCGTVRTGWPQD